MSLFSAFWDTATKQADAVLSNDRLVVTIFVSIAVAGVLIGKVVSLSSKR